MPRCSPIQFQRLLSIGIAETKCGEMGRIWCEWDGSGVPSCLYDSWACDGYPHCTDGSDEDGEFCGKSKKLLNINLLKIIMTDRCNLNMLPIVFHHFIALYNNHLLFLIDRLCLPLYFALYF